MNHEQKKAYWAHLDKRIPELQRKGVPGRLAREQADEEYAAAKKAEAGRG